MKAFTRKALSPSVKSGVSFNAGDFALVSCENAKINNKQIEAIRRLLKRVLKGCGKG
jgi:ribosomal protein L16/L10AE